MAFPHLKMKQSRFFLEEQLLHLCLVQPSEWFNRLLTRSRKCNLSTWCVGRFMESQLSVFVRVHPVVYVCFCLCILRFWTLCVMSLQLPSYKCTVSFKFKIWGLMRVRWISNAEWMSTRCFIIRSLKDGGNWKYLKCDFFVLCFPVKELKK